MVGDSSWMLSVSRRSQNRSERLEGTMPKSLMPEILVQGGECGLAKFKSAAAKVAAKPEINQALGARWPASRSPEQSHFSSAPHQIRATEADGNAAPYVKIEAIAVGLRRSDYLGGCRLIGCADPCLQIFRNRQRLADSTRIRVYVDGDGNVPV